jgi:uncharacterized membrane-anchored protein YhcB (DUF1043 family)
MTLSLVTSILIFSVGVGLGILLQRYLLSRGTHVALLEKEVDQLKGEQLHLKDSLQQHFHQTADLANELTSSYKALYEHLAGGAEKFTEKPLADLKQVLEQSQNALTQKTDSLDDDPDAAMQQAFPEEKDSNSDHKEPV